MGAGKMNHIRIVMYHDRDTPSEYSTSAITPIIMVPFGGCIEADSAEGADTVRRTFTESPPLLRPKRGASRTNYCELSIQQNQQESSCSTATPIKHEEILDA
jgi:hypothetical protein